MPQAVMLFSRQLNTKIWDSEREFGHVKWPLQASIIKEAVKGMKGTILESLMVNDSDSFLLSTFLHCLQ